MRSILITTAIIGALTGIPAVAADDAKREEAMKLATRADEMLENDRAADALPLARRAKQIFEAELGANDRLVADASLLLADIYRNVRRYADAEGEIKRALPIYEALDRTDPQNKYALRGIRTAHTTLGRVYEDQEQFDQAEASYRKALDWAVKRERKGNPAADHGPILRLTTFYGDWAWGLLQQKRYPEAEAIYKKGIALRRADGKPEPMSAVLYDGLAKIYTIQGKTADAKRMEQRAIELLK